MRQWWSVEVLEIEKALETSLKEGLSSQEAVQRLSKYGLNQLKEKKPVSSLTIFLEQFKDFIVWVLAAAALVSGFLKEWVDAIAILALVILNAILGFIQEYRAERALSALKKLSSPNSKVIRNGKHDVISSSQLVPGDLIELEAGDNVPGDCRLVWITTNFSVQEASLTGESVPVAKTTLSLKEKEVNLADRANMVYMGTSVSSGKARAVVTETGMDTELGKIAGMIEDIPHDQTPLQKKLEQFGKWIVYVCFVLVGMVFLIGLLRGGSVLDLFLTSVSLAVAAIPEGLPAVVTIALAMGVQRMVKRNALIRKLPSVETLGSVTVICSDKTGTLTKNEMTVQNVFTNNILFQVTGIGYEPKGSFLIDGNQIKIEEYSELKKALNYAVLCNGAQLVKTETGYKIVGDPTEAAILSCAGKAGIWKEDAEKESDFIEEIPFDSERKKMTIVRRIDNRIIAFVKGAPEEFIEDCNRIEEKGIVGHLADNDKKKLISVNDELASRAMRVLAFGYRVFEETPDKYEAEFIEKDLVFLGLVAMIDPPREEVKEAIKKCNTAGIRTVMITGDHKNTAISIARQLGFFTDESIALTGDDLDKLSDDELYKKVRDVSVYARVSPEHKLKIVRFLRKNKGIVAMTGDGVNDAPSVKEADIGVAMGITGTDVTKEVSDMIITDDNFASIVSAVEEGRGIYHNIQKFIHYLLSCNIGEILVMFIASLLGMPSPLIPIQILWVNLVTDGLPALALGVDPVDKDIMMLKPRPSNEPVVTKDRALIMFWQGFFIAMCSLSAFCLVLYVENEGIERARTAAFIVLACSQLFHSFNCRNLTQSIFKIGFLTNKKLIIATLISFFLQIGVVYLPFTQKIFKTQALTALDWCLVLLISSFPLLAMEIVKKVFYSKKS